MFIQRENALKAHQYNIILFYTKKALKKKTILIQNLIKIFTKTHEIAFLPNFLA